MEVGGRGGFQEVACQLLEVEHRGASRNAVHAEEQDREEAQVGRFPILPHVGVDAVGLRVPGRFQVE